jgi:predicted  nucleic acid-binding Zn-ribbon protein
MEPPATRPVATPNVVPSNLEVDYDKNITRLYQAITSCDWDEALSAIKRNPEEARTWVVRYSDEEVDDDDETQIMWRFLPIHSACARQPPASVIQALLHAYPDSAKCIDDQGMYALHYACGNHASREVIRLLLMSFPDAAKIDDPQGMLPIHYLACWGPSSVSVIDMVLVANRDVASAHDHEGQTPIDLALDGQYPERNAVVAALKRWLDNTVSGKSDHSNPTSSKEDISRGGSSLNSTIKTNSLREEKKESETSPYSPIREKLESVPDVATPRTVGRLQYEIQSLKSDQEKLETSWEQRLVSQKDQFGDQMHDLSQRLKDLEIEQNESCRQIAMLQQDLQDRDKEVLETKEDLEETRTQLSTAEEERDALRETLADLTEQHDKFKKRSEMMGDRLGSLNASLFSMMDQQTVVLDAMKAREAQLSALSNLRRNKMKELVAMEEEDPEEETDLRSCLLKQTKEMEAITAVIAAVRQK